MGAHQIKRVQGKIFCPRIKGVPFIRYFRVFYKLTPNNVSFIVLFGLKVSRESLGFRGKFI